MAELIPETLQKKLSSRLGFYEDLGIRLFYRERAVVAAPGIEQRLEPPATAHFAIPARRKEDPLPKPAGKPALPGTPPVVAPVSPKVASLPVVAGPSLFESIEKIVGDSLLKTREDLGECTRCKLHSTRHKIVFGDGNPKAELVFVGEGPGADEDAQGLPFVGRAGKLLTQMIEAMGLRREDVYIANIVKCRPPENRQPQEDEVATCMPFLVRQLGAIEPKVIVCLGSTAAQSLLGTKKSISAFRGQWFDFHGAKLISTYHPAYLLRNPNAKPEVWADLKKAMAVLGLTPPKPSRTRT